MRPETLGDAMRDAMDVEAHAIKHAAPCVNSFEFEFVVKNLHEYPSPIILSGMGKSGLVAQRAAATWSSVGLCTVYVHPVEAMHGDLGRVPRGGFVIGISHSGETQELNQFMQTAVTHRGARAALLSSRPGSFLEYHFLREAVHDIPTASVAVQSAILDAMLVSYVKLHGVSDQDFKRYHPGGTIGGQ